MSDGLRMYIAGRTDVGLIREHNEDNLTVVDLERRATEPMMGVREMQLGARGALLIVCDGMGGAAAGEVASAMAIEAFSGYLLEHTAEGIAPDADAGDGEALVRFARWMREGAFDANRRIYEASRADENKSGMGTTMTTVGVLGTDLVMAQVGDSRAYVLRDGAFTQVTRDQSLVNQLIETGQITEEQARLFEHSNVILQALGVQDEVEVLLSTVPLRRGDRVVVCTDGLTGVVTDEEVAAVLASTDDMDEVCRLLIEMARTGGGPDNITVVAARFDDAGLPAAAPAEKVVYKRWRLDEPEEVAEPGRAASGREWPAVGRRRRVDPARTFFSLMLLLALSLGGLVMAEQLHRSGGRPCTLVAAAGYVVRVDGRDTGRRTQGMSGTTLRLPLGKHRVALARGGGGHDDVRQVEITATGECRITFEEER